ncbi:MAG TPA: ABC transporter permease [Herpetosiphonaceae bacterium]
MIQEQATDPAPLARDEQLPKVKVKSAIGARFGWLRGILRNPKAVFGLLILIVFALTAALAPVVAKNSPSKFVGKPHQAPSAKYWFGTQGQGKDVFAQTVWGARTSLTVGFATGLLTTFFGIVIGMTAGYFGGWVDDVLSLFTNVVLIIPGLPLLTILAAFLSPGKGTIILVLSLVGWAWPARVMRSQTLTLRTKDFVASSIVAGENHFTIIFREILPNMTSLIASSMFGSIIYAIGAETSLSFLGLTNVSDVSWGTNLYWAQNNAGLLVGAWWTILPSGLCVALIAFALAMINYAMDEITNPRLRAERELSNVFKQRTVLATPVIRDGK